MIPPPAPTCHRQAAKPMTTHVKLHVRGFATASIGPTTVPRRVAQVVG